VASMVLVFIMGLSLLTLRLVSNNGIFLQTTGFRSYSRGGVQASLIFKQPDFALSV
jgi:hypothetical protein